MALVKARYLVDKSALARLPIEAVRLRLAPIIEAGEAATCAIIDLEVLYSTRNGEDHGRTLARRRLAFESVPLDMAIFERAIEVQGLLARTGQHRLPIPDLIVAAAAEAAGLTLLHYDTDFERIAKVTDQPIEWIVARGSL